MGLTERAAETRLTAVFARLHVPEALSLVGESEALPLALLACLFADTERHVVDAFEGGVPLRSTDSRASMTE